MAEFLAVDCHDPKCLEVLADTSMVKIEHNKHVFLYLKKKVILNT